MGTFSILIANENEITRAGLEFVLSVKKNFSVVSRVADGRELFRSIEKDSPHIVLLGLSLPPKDIHRILREIQKRKPAIQILVLADGLSEAEIIESIRAGAKGHLSFTASAETLRKAVGFVAQGEYWIDRKTIGKLFAKFLDPTRKVKADRSGIEVLSKRERDVLKLVSQGLKNKEIAERLFISEKTVKTHLARIFAKLKIKDRVQAALYVIENNPGI